MRKTFRKYSILSKISRLSAKYTQYTQKIQKVSRMYEKDVENVQKICYNAIVGLRAGNFGTEEKDIHF